MPTKYQVAPARSVYLPDNTLARQGQPLPTGIPKKLLKEWIASGFVIEQGASPATVSSSPPVPSEGPLSQAKQRAAAAAPKIKTNGKYTYSPADLEGKSLEELNLLLVDLDTDPADTEEEAIGILTSDFNGDDE